MSQSITPEQVRAWVQQHFPDHKSRRNGEELQICNPFDGDTGYNLNISTSRLACHDWRGDHWAGYDSAGKPRKRTFLRFVQLHLGCSWSTALSSVLGQDARRLMFQWTEPEEPVVPEEPLVELPTGSTPLASTPESLLTRILLDWLGSRGVPLEEVKRHNLHEFATDVVWPYYEYDQLVYWQQRSRLSKRFLFPSSDVGVTKGQFLFGFDQVEPASHVIVTEAIFGVHALREQAVATGGAAMTKQQVAKLRALSPRDGVILAPDNDKAGIASLVHNGNMLLRCGFKLYYSLPPRLPYEVEGQQQFTKDWNELGEHGLVAWGEIQSVLERRIRKLNQQELLLIQLGRVQL